MGEFKTPTEARQVFSVCSSFIETGKVPGFNLMADVFTVYLLVPTQQNKSICAACIFAWGTEALYCS